MNPFDDDDDDDDDDGDDGDFNLHRRPMDLYIHIGVITCCNLSSESVIALAS